MTAPQVETERTERQEPFETEVVGAGAGAIDGGLDADIEGFSSGHTHELDIEAFEPEMDQRVRPVVDAEAADEEDRFDRGEDEAPDDAAEGHDEEREEGEAKGDGEDGRPSTGSRSEHGRSSGRRQERDDRRRYRDDRRTSEIEPGSAPPPTKPGVMVVNDTPGEECRIAILREGVLEQLFMERATTATQVGNIYKGRVTNVEPAIQAAFVDYGQGQAGFLHISDLHPKYFPRGDKTERVGKKIPRRDRPLMQEALRRGDEVIVQVLKQGLGTKGPTLTSYLSIAGRLLVMMPWMDKSGVSRKVDDEDQRREMRQILDSLNLPDGFGFILRTAGFDRTKLELHRDAAYLLRLWKVMEKRMHAVGAPCALYTESDLLIRTIRDVVDSTIETIVVDSESAFTRARAFLEVVAPRSAPMVRLYDRQVPIFHAFDIERQIELTHSRIVPLPSGGALVIDQTEALVAIDVNSGKSRAARDSETNAYQTNIEAVAEIARQLRLRDLGGVVICDLIDMRSQRHRRDIEERFRQHLRRDRARATTAPISDFGILEMTRQRMRPSLRKTHYIDCPHCDGHGEIKMPDAVAGDALRSIAHLLHYDRVKRVEMVCSTRVASILLSGRRRMIDELEDRSDKRVEIRISEALALDRVDLYAYDDRGADIDITKLPSVSPPKVADLATEVQPRPEVEEEGEEETGGRGRRRRRRKPAPADATTIALEGGFDDLPFELDDQKPAIPAGRAPVSPAPNGQRSADEDEGESLPTGAAGVASGGAADGGRGGEQRSEQRQGRDRRDGRRDRRGDNRGGGESRRGPDAPAEGAGQRGQRGQQGQPGRARPEQTRTAAPAPSAPATTDGAATDGVSEGERRRRRRRRKGGLRLGELARQVDVPVRDLVLRCRSERIFNLQDELSRVPDEQAALIRGWYGVAAPAETDEDGDFGDDRSSEDGLQGVAEADGEVDAAPDPASAGRRSAHRESEVHEAPSAAGSGAGSLDGVSTAAEDAKPLRVFELAKELSVPSKELVARCLEHSVEGVRNHMSSLSAEARATVRGWFAPPVASAPPKLAVAAAPVVHDRAPEGAPEDGASAGHRPERGSGRGRDRDRGANRGGGRGPDRGPAPTSDRRAGSPAERTVDRVGEVGRDAQPAARVDQGHAQRGGSSPASAMASSSTPASAPKPAFRPLYSAGRSRKPLPVKRDSDRGD